MKKAVTIALVATLALAACKKSEPSAENEFDGSPGHGGRYLGIGIYSVNDLWEQLVQKERPKDAPPQNPQAALLADDTEIIVSIDSRTGEVRQCGNYSGLCISSNPWHADAVASPTLLAKHAADLERERDEKQKEDEAKLKKEEATLTAAVTKRHRASAAAPTDGDPAN